MADSKTLSNVVIKNLRTLNLMIFKYSQNSVFNYYFLSFFTRSLTKIAPAVTPGSLLSQAWQISSRTDKTRARTKTTAKNRRGPSAKDRYYKDLRNCKMFENGTVQTVGLTMTEILTLVKIFWPQDLRCQSVERP